MNFVNDIKTVAVAFAVISSGYRSQALLYTHSDQRYIRRYGIHDPTQGTSRPLYGWGRDYATDFWVSLCFMAVLRAG